MKVLIYPEAVGNPYHKLLYGSLAKHHPESTFTYLRASPKIIILFPIYLMYFRIKGYRIFHLHWHAFWLDKKTGILFAEQVSFIFTIFCLFAIKLLGYSLVWTVHDMLPHEKQTSNDTYISRLTVRLSSALIIHSKNSIQELEQYGASSSKISVIPHGNYIGAYADNVSRINARKKLSVKDDEFVFLFIGSIRPYKGIDDLIKAFSLLRSKSARLIIAGSCSDQSLRNDIVSAKKNLKIDFYDGFIKDDDLAMFFKAADVVTLPFKAITTSGSILLALSFGKPVIAPLSNDLLELPSNVGFMYDPNDPEALLESLKQASTGMRQLANKGQAAIKYAKTLDWGKISDQTFNVYSKLRN